MTNQRPLKVCVIINPAFSLSLLRAEWHYYLEQGIELRIVTSPDEAQHRSARERGIQTRAVAIARYPSPIEDFLSLIRLWWFLVFHRFDCLHISTPKASFLGALAGRLSGHRQIFYIVRGQAYANFKGWKLRLMRLCERISCASAATVVPISLSLGEHLVSQGLCARDKIRYVGSGSDRGVNLSVFSLGTETVERARCLRAELGIASDHVVILSVGWLRRDKGTNELVRAFGSLANEHSDVDLVLLGDYELSDPLESDVVEGIESAPRIHRLARRPHPAPVFALADIFGFPSHREGFGNVIIEASAMELPVVATDAIGCRDAVVNGETGIVVPLFEVDALANALKQLVEDRSERRRLGRNGRERVEREFSEDRIFAGFTTELRKLAARHRGCELHDLPGPADDPSPLARS